MVAAARAPRHVPAIHARHSAPFDVGALPMPTMRRDMCESLRVHRTPLNARTPEVAFRRGGWPIERGHASLNLWPINLLGPGQAPEF